MKMSKFLKKTIIFKLITTVILIFSIMIMAFNFSINGYQNYVLEKIEKKIEPQIGDDTEKSRVIFIDDEDIDYRGEFELYTVLVSLVITLLGAIFFYAVITKVMSPFRELAKKVSMIDMDNLHYMKNELVLKNSDIEIQELANVLNTTFSKIYKSYEREKNFSINIAHEIRTPLSILLTKIDVFNKKTTKTDADIDEFVTSMRNNIQRLSDMTNTLMMLNKNNELNRQIVNINELIEEIILDLEDVAEEKNVTLSFKSNVMSIYADDQLLERAIFNIVENAIKYNVYGGKVDISMKNSNNDIIIKVSDTGTGIEDEEKKYIFDLFYRVDKSRSRQTGGYGIGLCLVKNIVERLNGEITIEDNIPNGSIFNIILKDSQNKTNQYINIQN